MRVGIAAYGMTPFTTNDVKIEPLLVGSAVKLFQDNPSVDRDLVDAVLVSTNDNSKYLAPIVSEMIGISPNTTHSIENLCNSGTNSLVSAYSYIASGLADLVLVCGAERCDSPGRILKWDNSRGEFGHPVFWASLFTSSYKHKFRVLDTDLATVPAKNHKQARENPNAVSDRIYSIEEITTSKKITDNIRLLDCSRSCAGSASVLLASEEMTKKISDSPVWITGIGQKTTSAGFARNRQFDSMESTIVAGQSALKMARVSPSDIDVAEVHDAFSVCEPMALESLGLARSGRGIAMVQNLHDEDNFMINPRGGLIGAGHPLGATGIAQTIEITQQLQSDAGGRQVDDAKVGLVHNMSAAATSSTVLVMER